MDSSASSGARPSGIVNFDDIDVFVDIEKRIDQVVLIKRFIKEVVFLHWGLLFSVDGRFIVFEFFDSGLSFTISGSLHEAYEQFLPSPDPENGRRFTTTVYWREMKSFRRVKLADVKKRLKLLHRKEFSDESYHSVRNNCQDFVRALARPFDDAVDRLAIVLHGLIASDEAAYAKDVENAKLNALVGMETYEVEKIRPKELGSLQVDENTKIAQSTYYVKREDRHGKFNYTQTALKNETDDMRLEAGKVGAEVELGKKGVGIGVEAKILNAEAHVSDNVTLSAGLQMDTGVAITREKAGLSFLGFGFEVKNGQDESSVEFKLPFFGFKRKL